MKYKFIGTEQDLIDNGFMLTLDNQLGYSKNDNLRNFELLISMNDNPFYEKRVVYNNYLCGRDIISSDIQDLIDKGLVVEV